MTAGWRASDNPWLHMLTPDERAALVVYCSDHPVAVCPQCAEAVSLDRIGADVVLGRRDFCPACRSNLVESLRAHLKECTWIRVQVRETRARAQQIRQQAQETAKKSQQLRDAADVLAREAEDARRKSGDARRGQPDGTTTPSLAGIRIIAVEPHEELREMLDQSLRLLGATVLAVTTARDAVARMSEADIIVTDVAMGSEDGVWLWERVSRGPRPIPVVAVTGYTAEQYPRMKQADFARTLLKPVVPDDLAIVLREVLDGGIE